MKTLLAFLLSLAALTNILADNYPASEKIAKTYPIASHGELIVENVNGSIEVVAWDGNEISLEAEKRAKTTEDLQQVIIHIVATPDRLTIKTEYKKTGWFGLQAKGEVRYSLRVPFHLKLTKIETVNAKILIQNVCGPVEAESVNGSLQAEGLASSASLETVNGSITASFDEISPNQSISLESVNGSCKLVLPQTASASIKTETVNGAINCKFPITDTESRKNKLHGQIGHGPGANVQIETVNGSITLQPRD